jgi:hypothetical protein
VRATCSWGILVAAAATAAIAHADSAGAAAKHMEKGLRLYNTQDYDGAITEWRQAYLLVPSADTLFAIGQAQRLKGDCNAAVLTYRNTMRETTKTEQRAEIQKVIDVCEEKLKAEIVERQKGPQPLPVAAPAAPREMHVPWYNDPLAVSLLIGGSAGLAVGGTFVMLARSAEDDAEAATNYQSFASSARRAERNRTIGIVGFAAGGAMIIGGLVRIITRDDTLTVEATDKTATVSLTRRF